MIKKLLFCGLLGLFWLSACQPTPPLPRHRQLTATAPPTPSPGPSSPWYTARDGWQQVSAQAQAWAPDAQLYRVEGQWVTAGGWSQHWGYLLYSAQLQQQIVLKLDGSRQLLPPQPPPAAFLEPEHWQQDSGAALNYFAALQPPDQPLLLPLSQLLLEAPGHWKTPAHSQKAQDFGF